MHAPNQGAGMKKALYIIITITVLLTACTKEYITENPVQINSEEATSCTNSASFIADVTIPDHTEIEPGENFTKIWRVENTGTCIWNEDYRLAFAMNSQMGAPDFLPLGVVNPGEELDISVEMTAPEGAGSYRADFRLLDPDDEVIEINDGQYLWTIITVNEP
jgi:hypothetical protein